MKNLKFLLTSIACLLLTACKVDPIASHNVGVFQGYTSEGKTCQIGVSVGVVPVVGLTTVRLAFKIFPGSEDDVTSTKILEHDFAQNGGPGVPNTLKIIEGDRKNPKVAQFKDEVQFRLENRIITEVHLLKTGEQCVQLVKQPTSKCDWGNLFCFIGQG